MIGEISEIFRGEQGTPFACLFLSGHLSMSMHLSIDLCIHLFVPSICLSSLVQVYAVCFPSIGHFVSVSF